ncbi:nuclear transport factor 2 family protein [Nocardiopsis sp. LDBS1602]|uniref:nuclear transport factor 2 family protein n=1 Tax=Nocardiopsis sp. LDBS1602 TaxID=3109597 RepID=UPI002DB85585|nr:nuclear transport factor 2 family protein [Nocardiopsis sp. LDBS1602]MEC3895947.1 nuclear transport factor 2 family protein [Nocardiopsis sp. LDBS1602]
MSERRRIVSEYAAAFATRDLPTILSHVDDSLVWELNGERVGTGKEEFERQMTRDLATGGAVVTIDRFIEDTDVVVALQHGEFVPDGQDGGLPFSSAEVYSFEGDRIVRIQTWQAT